VNPRQLGEPCAVERVRLTVVTISASFLQLADGGMGRIAMSEQDNLEVVQSAYDVFAKGNLPALLDLRTSDA
jgi:hypothetical protein